MPIMPNDTLLMLPSATHVRSYQSAVAEGYEPDRAAPPVSRIEAHLEWLNRQDDEMILADGTRSIRPPHVHLWMVHAYTFIGRVNVRFRLNEALQSWGGNIGYEIRPSFRGRGFGTQILAMALPVARNAGLPGVLLTALDTNTASIRIIEANGGRMVSAGPHPYHPEQTVRRFWIDLPA
jgi:predicted acetyltransferase